LEELIADIAHTITLYERMIFDGRGRDEACRNPT